MTGRTMSVELLTNGTDAFYRDLERRAKRNLIVYRDQALPPGASPRRSPVGVEIAPGTGEAILRTNPAAYHGPGGPVRTWLESGELRFSSFAGLRRFLRDELAKAYRARPASPARARPGVEDVVDLAQVQSTLARAADEPRLEDDELFALVTEQVRGQDAAIRILADTVTRHLAKLKPRRPATLFALGPTGVGKTRTAEVLAGALGALGRGGAYRYLRLDMNQYQERHRVSELLGAPQGYIGYGDGAELVDTLSASPRVVVLFDEIEKAHPSLFQVLMNAMDAGRLTRAAGGGDRQIDCRKAIFMFTSNIDVGAALNALVRTDALHEPAAVNRECANALLQAGAPPEIVGRIQAFLPFTPLDESARAAIMTLAIQRIAAEYGIGLARIEPGVVVELLSQSRDARFGARSHEHVVEQALGRIFGSARSSARRGAWTLTGPPFQLVQGLSSGRSG